MKRSHAAGLGIAAIWTVVCVGACIAQVPVVTPPDLSQIRPPDLSRMVMPNLSAPYISQPGPVFSPAPMPWAWGFNNNFSYWGWTGPVWPNWSPWRH